MSVLHWLEQLKDARTGQPASTRWGPSGKIVNYSQLSQLPTELIVGVNVQPIGMASFALLPMTTALSHQISCSVAMACARM